MAAPCLNQQGSAKATPMEHRNISFKIDILGVDTWRWTILPRTPRDLTLVGQVRATHEQAIAHCKAEIDAMLARESEESKSDQSRLISPVAR